MMAVEKACVIALAGNPNAGKTALFNVLTGSNHKVGNWPGVTVEKRDGRYRYLGQSYCLIDLPGTYSLNVISEEGGLDQRIACQYLLSPEADVILNVVDGNHLERNLFLTLQLLELGIPTVLAVNMMDLVEKDGLQLDLKKLSQKLGCPVVGISARQRQGLEELRAAIASTQKNQARRSPPLFELPLPSALTSVLPQLTERIVQYSDLRLPSFRWLAQRLLEGDLFAQQQVSREVQQFAEQLIAQIEATAGETPDILIADARYGVIDALVLSITTIHKTRRRTLTEVVDRIVLNRYLGIPLFFFVMYLMFVLSINVGGALQDFFDLSSTTLFIDGVSYVLQRLQTPPWLLALVADGVGRGLNTVLTFIPVLAALFFSLALLEDCGYMVRAAFVMDRLMRVLGLPGKSFVPMMVGFGCNVPAVMGARSLEGRRDRILAVLMMPFMSCGARLAIFSVFVSAFFPTNGGYIVFLLYFIGMLAAMLTGLLLRKTLLRGEPSPLVMELPTYHRPALLPLCRHTWSRLKQFIFRAGLVILPVCMIIGGLNAVTTSGQLIQGDSSQQQHSVLSAMGRAVTPLLSPMGVSQENWPATVGLVTGILAKEVVVGTLNTLYSQSKSNFQQEKVSHFNLLAGMTSALQTIPENFADLWSALKNPLLASEAPHDMTQTAYGMMYQRFSGSKAAAFAYLLFVLLYFPCVSTMAATRRELGRAWAVFSVCWSTGFAYVAAVIVYQAITITHHFMSSLLWIISLSLCLLVIVGVLRFCSGRSLKSSERETFLFTENS